MGRFRLGRKRAKIGCQFACREKYRIGCARLICRFFNPDWRDHPNENIVWRRHVKNTAESRRLDEKRRKRRAK